MSRRFAQDRGTWSGHHSDAALPERPFLINSTAYSNTTPRRTSANPAPRVTMTQGGIKRDTASTTSFSEGNPDKPFLLTTRPSTATSKMPPVPLIKVASSSSSSFSTAAARAALGAYPHAVQ
jgi:hypothetical protein